MTPCAILHVRDAEPQPPEIVLSELIQIRASSTPWERPSPDELGEPEESVPQEMEFGSDLDEPEAPAEVNDLNELANAIAGHESPAPTPLYVPQRDVG